MSLDAASAGTFSHGNSRKTVWLSPSTQRVQELQALLQAKFPECDADQRPFQPHLSLGQATGDSDAERLGEETKRAVSDFVGRNGESAAALLEWHVDRVHVIRRKGYKGRFRITENIELGKAILS